MYLSKNQNLLYIDIYNLQNGIQQIKIQNFLIEQKLTELENNFKIDFDTNIDGMIDTIKPQNIFDAELRNFIKSTKIKIAIINFQQNIAWYSGNIYVLLLLILLFILLFVLFVCFIS